MHVRDLSGQSFEMKVQESFCRDNEGKKFQNLFGKYFILFFQMMKTTYGTKDNKSCISTENYFQNSWYMTNTFEICIFRQSLIKFFVWITDL